MPQDREDRFVEARRHMVETQIEARGIKDERLLEVLRRVPRHLFIPEGQRQEAYADEPLPIGQGQTISQPYIVAYMTEKLKLRGPERVLEVGTGSGYQTAVLAELSSDVFSIEVVEPLALKAQNLLSELGYSNIHYKVGDGNSGWEEFAPFDGILVTAAAPEVPAPLRRQLKDGGRMILPRGTFSQELVLIIRQGDTFRQSELIPVRFVPLITIH
jgi:protein-L-isoaspartate(D-aspartate) O-methyltransferase